MFLKISERQLPGCTLLVADLYSLVIRRSPTQQLNQVYS